MSEQPPKPFFRVACALIERDGRLLVARRGAGKARAGKWELPGGKIDDSETPSRALVREIAEELGCTVRVLDVLSGTAHAYPDIALELIPIRCEIVSGQPRAIEHAEIRWAGAEELAALEWSDADVPIVRAYVSARTRRA
jgi:8-oxo-dGTP diphosphatase